MLPRIRMCGGWDLRLGRIQLDALKNEREARPVGGGRRGASRLAVREWLRASGIPPLI